MAREAIRRGPVPALLILTAVLALMVLYYFARPDTIGVHTLERGWRRVTSDGLTPLEHYLASGVLLAAIPLLVARFAGGFRLRDLGLGIGRWREGLVWLTIGIPLAVVAGKMAAMQGPMRMVYPLDPLLAPRAGPFASYALWAALYYGGWEVLFRGVLLFGLSRDVGAGTANVIQTALSAVAHFGRAFNETFSALPAGLVFGFITLRTRSIWYVAIIHWTVGMSMEWFMLARPV